MGIRPSKNLTAFKREYRKSGNIKASMLTAGYAESSSNMGISALPKKIQTFVLTRKRKLDKLEKLGQALTAQQQENAVRGALLANVVAGKDQAVNSLKLLGQDKRVAMFTPESTTGIIVIQAAAIPSFEALPAIPAIVEGK